MQPVARCFGKSFAGWLWVAATASLVDRLFCHVLQLSDMRPVCSQIALQSRLQTGQNEPDWQQTFSSWSAALLHKKKDPSVSFRRAKPCMRPMTRDSTTQRKGIDIWGTTKEIITQLSFCHKGVHPGAQPRIQVRNHNEGPARDRFAEAMTISANGTFGQQLVFLCCWRREMMASLFMFLGRVAWHQQVSIRSIDNLVCLLPVNQDLPPSPYRNRSGYVVQYSI